MKIKCEYCDSYISDTDEKCPNCGAVNNNLKRVGNDVPTTIEELKKWYKDHNLPDENITRFFIGKNYEEPRAFGIYFDEDKKNYIVYKNKSDGSRAIRYEGKDEKYAVNELYLKLKEEIQNQKNHNKTNTENKKLTFVFVFMIFIMVALLEYSTIYKLPIFLVAILMLSPVVLFVVSIYQFITAKTKDKFIYLFIDLFMVFCIFICILGIITGRDTGYYKINGNNYYLYNNDWYIYDNGWNTTSKPDYSGSLEDYYQSKTYESNSDYSDFENTSYWNEYHSSSDWDSDSSWSSSDSWDSGGTDWSSDW